DFVDQPVAMSVENVNATPFIDDIPDQEIHEDADAQVINLSNISAGAGEEAKPVTVTAVSSNATKNHDPYLRHNRHSATGTITFQPAANQYATGTPVTIPVTVTDTEDPPLSYSVSFDVTVNAVNDFPELDALPNISIDEDSGPQTVNLSGISPGPEEGSQSVTITATSNNPTLIPNPTVNYSGGANGSISFTPAADRSGAAQITVTVTDNGSPQREVSRTFTVTVNEVNDLPTINPIDDVSVPENSLLVPVNFSGITDGSPNETQITTVNVQWTNPSLFLAVLPVYIPGSPSGTINITP